MAEFHDTYFPVPLYRDEKLEFYEALGNASILQDVSYNPFKIWRGMKEMGNRLKGKNLEGNYKGEGLTKGGIIIFGTDGKPRYVYPEETGSEIEVEEFLTAVQSVREGQMTPAEL